MTINPKLKYDLTKTILDNLFKHTDRLCETSNNAEAVNALFELKMRLWNELRNLLNACHTEQDIIFLLPATLKAAALGFSFNEPPYYAPSDAVRAKVPLAEKVVNSVKEQQILELLLSR